MGRMRLVRHILCRIRPICLLRPIHTRSCRMTRARLEGRDARAQPAATPCLPCPLCGKLMRQRTARQAPNAG